MASSIRRDFGIRVSSANLSNFAINSFFMEEVKRVRFTSNASATITQPCTILCYIVYTWWPLKTRGCILHKMMYNSARRWQPWKKSKKPVRPAAIFTGTMSAGAAQNLCPWTAATAVSPGPETKPSTLRPAIGTRSAGPKRQRARNDRHAKKERLIFQPFFFALSLFFQAKPALPVPITGQQKQTFLEKFLSCIVKTRQRWYYMNGNRTDVLYSWGNEGRERKSSGMSALWHKKCQSKRYVACSDV